MARHKPIGDLKTFTLPDDPELRMYAMESLFVRRLYWYGLNGYEQGEDTWWREFCAKATNIVEMGCNVGFYSVLGGLAAPAARYRAVDPLPDAIAAAGRNLALNGVTNVELLQCAVVGDSAAGTAVLTLPAHEVYAAPTGSYLAGAEGVGDRGSRGTITVPTMAASELLEDVDLVKLDIEGLEAEVLTAGMAVILANRPTIFLEVRRKATSLREVIRELHRNDYVALAIGQSLHVLTAHEIESPADLPRYGSRDIILIPIERVGSL